jgi:hypothetical protein
MTLPGAWSPKVKRNQTALLTAFGDLRGHASQPIQAYWQFLSSSLD